MNRKQLCYLLIVSLFATSVIANDPPAILDTATELHVIEHTTPLVKIM